MEAGETAPKALEREIIEELNIHVEVGQCLGRFATPLDKYVIQLECYWCVSDHQEVKLTSHDEAGWFTASELLSLDWALPDVPTLDLVIKKLLQTT